MERIIKREYSAKGTLLSGAFFLTLSTLLVKLSGLLYKIPMLSILGVEGMGYFNSAYELYTLFSLAATAGLPVALSVLLADALAKGDLMSARRIDRTALFLFSGVGVAGSLLLALFAKRFCGWIQSDHAYSAIKAISPTLLFTCLSSWVRGYFQGHSKMLPTALSQLAESVLKLIFGVLFCSLAAGRGATIDRIAACAGLGLSLGAALTFLGLFIAKQKYGRGQRVEKIENADRRTLKNLFCDLARISLPVTLGVSLTGCTRILDMAMILRRLQGIGFSSAAANEMYGAYTTLAISVFGLLPSFVNSVALPLVPLLSAAFATGDREREAELTRFAFRLIALFAVPGAIGITAFSGELLSLLFRGQETAVSIAAPLLSSLGISAFLSAMIGGITSVLHARKIVVRPLLVMLLGAAVKSVSAYFLIGNPKVGILGAPLSTLLCNLVVTVFGMLLVSEGGRREPRASIFFAPLISSLGSIVIFAWAYRYFDARRRAPNLFFFVGIFLAVAMYFGLSWITGALKREDFSFIGAKKDKNSKKVSQNKQFFQK